MTQQEGAPDKRPVDRIDDVLDALREFWRKPENQDLRLGQALHHFATSLSRARGFAPSPEMSMLAVINVEDSDLLAMLRLCNAGEADLADVGEALLREQSD